MNISVFGLGYVGCISLGCLAQSGHTVIGVDINPAKVQLIRSGKPTILEDQIAGIIAEQFKAGRITATVDHEQAVKDSELSILCVGTPASATGHPDLGQVRGVARGIAETLKDKDTFHTIVIRSTVPPGTNAEVTALVEEYSRKKAGEGFAVVSNPEFLREGSAVDDYYHPPVTLAGTLHETSVPVIKELYREMDEPVTFTDVKVAEMIKYVNNSFHALKVGFANEVGNICKRLGIDSHKVMDIFVRDRRLNISPAYLRPGFAYGGSCLPKDLNALTAAARDLYLEVPIIDAIARSNDRHKQLLLDLILKKGKKNIGILGLSFKPGTDDLRNSPAVELVERLLGKGLRVLIHDRNVVISKLVGANMHYIREHLPHISDIIFDDLRQVVDASELLVITHNHKEYRELEGKYPDKIIIDLVRIIEGTSHDNYEGICW